ncbi:carboxymuconolactone decarboxylase family protein [Pollutimonas bauzanensis]|uniref:Alkylhydroperoxidase family enzyme, contains CxxC motif n=1 Tax=Pollutimonas bauzanensis TaxID=658167 RepID=A0A1M5ZKZ7_9BURK|nr:carboxymuconolactone decarboxylase family protein [Pollutimonas bauzanensis]SHI24809.1 Alkylhydroperoxidase family enzyme, contains CxxC motif [Pollutimonas bauzanensis]
MQRIPLVPGDLAEPKHVVEAIRKRRGGELSNLDRLLLNSPVLAEAWNAFLGTVRQRLSLSPKVREIVMCAVAVINKAEYEFHHHAREFEKAGGSSAQVEAMQDVEAAARNAAVFNAQERMAFQLTLEMTRDIIVKEDAFEQANSLFSREELVDLIATIAAYNMVSRVVVACDIRPED